MNIKKTCAVLLLLTMPVAATRQPPEPKPMTVSVLGVHDGDTFTINLPLPQPINVIQVRIRHIDTPELGWRAKCDAENRLAIQARARTVVLLSEARTVTLKNYDWDKYARVLADVWVSKTNVGDKLIDEGLAVRYEGEGPKKDWCEGEP